MRVVALLLLSFFVLFLPVQTQKRKQPQFPARWNQCLPSRSDRAASKICLFQFFDRQKERREAKRKKHNFSTTTTKLPPNRSELRSHRRASLSATSTSDIRRTAGTTRRTPPTTTGFLLVACERKQKSQHMSSCSLEHTFFFRSCFFFHLFSHIAFIFDDQELILRLFFHSKSERGYYVMRSAPGRGKKKKTEGERRSKNAFHAKAK